MQLNKKYLLRIAVLMIVAGAAIFGIGYAVSQNEEGDYTVENQAYAVSDIQRIQIQTDSPSVVIKPVEGDQLRLTWETGEYMEYDAQLVNGELTIEYKRTVNWLQALLLMGRDDTQYVLEVELPNTYVGRISVDTASGAITADTPATLTECSLKTVSGSLEAESLNSQVSIELKSTSGKVSAHTLQADGDILVKTVSGSVSLLKSAAQGGVTIQTASGSVAAAELTAVDEFAIKTISGRVEVSDVQCDADVMLSSTSGSVRPSDIACKSLSVKTVSGSIKGSGITADDITLKSTSGSVSVGINGDRGDYTIETTTVSGGNNLQNATGSTGKALTVNTVSGSIKVSFTDGN